MVRLVLVLVATLSLVGAAPPPAIVGETTGGGTHPFEYRRVHPHFALYLPEGRSIHPITGGNWQGVGVKPDVAVPADQALDRALALAREAVAKDRSASASGLRSLP